MFHPDKIAEKILKSNADLIRHSPRDKDNRPIFPPSFKLQRHSITQVAQANSHIESLFSSEGKQLRPYTIDEVRWMRNERALCRCDFVYWATRYAFIIDWVGQLVRFDPNIAQLMSMDVFAELEYLDIAILIQALKARQLGITTLAELI